jgi:hypothetical protein
MQEQLTRPDQERRSPTPSSRRAGRLPTPLVISVAAVALIALVLGALAVSQPAPVTDEPVAPAADSTDAVTPEDWLKLDAWGRHGPPPAPSGGESAPTDADWRQHDSWSRQLPR